MLEVVLEDGGFTRSGNSSVENTLLAKLVDVNQSALSGGLDSGHNQVAVKSIVFWIHLS